MPTSYEAGEAFLSILPSMRGFSQRLRRELLGVQLELEVPIRIDRRGLAALRDVTRTLPTIVLDADSTPAERELAALRERIERLSGQTIGVDLSSAQARAELDSIRGDLQRLGQESPDIAVRVDAAAAEAALSGVQREAGRIDGRRLNLRVNADVGAALASLAAVALAAQRFANKRYRFSVDADTAGAVAQIALLASAVASLGGLAGVVGGFGGALGGLGAAGAVAAGGLLSAVVASLGVGKAIGALNQQQETAAQTAQQSARQQQSAAYAIASAQDRVGEASQRAAQTRQDGARAVADAERDAARSVEQAQQSASRSIAAALERQDQANRRLRATTSDLRAAQSALTDAWEEGRRSLQDLQDQVDDNQIDQRQAALDLRDARRELDEARAGGDVDQIERAQIAYDRQVEKIDQLRKRTQRLGTDNARAQAAGVEGTDAYRSALGRVADAQEQSDDAVRDAAQATTNLAKARIDGAREVADAEAEGARRVAQAREQAARQAAAADDAVIDARRALAQAMAQTADATADAQSKVDQAFADLSPAAAGFARYLFGLKPLLKSVSATAAEEFFPPLQRGFDALVGQAPFLTGVIATLAGSMGAGLELVLSQLASPFWLQFFGLLASSSTSVIPGLFGSLMRLAGAFAVLITHLLPLAPASFALLDQLSGLLVILSPFIAQLLGGLIPAASAFLSALVPLGPVLAALQPILLVLAQAFAQVLTALLQALAPILVALTPLIARFAMEWADGIVAALTAATPLIVGVAQFLSDHADAVVQTTVVVGGLVAAFQPLLWVLGVAVSLLHGFLVVRLVQAGLTALGLQGTLVGRAIMLLLSPMQLLRMLLPLVGQAVMFVGRALLAALGPVGLILTGLSLLYSSNEQFRNAVNGVLAVLGGLVSLLVSSLMPVLQRAIDAVVPLVGILASALVPVVDLVASVLVGLIEMVLPPFVEILRGFVIPAIVTVADILVTVLVWTIRNIVVPTLLFITAVITDVLVPVIMWLWRNVVQPAFQAIAAIVVWCYFTILKPIFDGIVFLLRNVVGPAVMWLYENAVRPAFTGLGQLIMWVYDNLIKPAFDALVRGVAFVRDGFESNVAAIGRHWDGLKRLLAVPINFLINTVFNGGIVPAWNAAAGLLPGVEPIRPLTPIPEYNRGGVLDGYSPGRDDRLIMAGGGEAIMRPEWTRAVGGATYVDAANRAARLGGVGGVQQFLTDTAQDTGRGAGRVRQNLMARVPLDDLFPAYAYGGVLPHVAAAGDEVVRTFGAMPGGIGGVGARANASDHPKGLALDFMTMTDSALGDRVTGHMIANARRLLVKYVIWRQQINQGNGWRGMEDRGSPTANHMDHPHVSFLTGGAEGREFSNEGGGFFDWIGDQIRGFFTDLTDPPLGLLRTLFPSPPRFMGIPAELATTARDGMLDFLLGESSTASMGDPGGAGVQRWRPVVEQALSMLGLPLNLVDTTLRRMNQESGGDPRAINNWDSNAAKGIPSKGLMQVIDPTFAANRDPRAPNDVWDPLANILASMKYALRRYGSLPSAYDRPGGYDQGGIANGVGWWWKGTGLDERVLDPVETQAYPTLTRLSQQLEGDRLAPAPADPARAAAAAAAAAMNSAPTTVTGELYLDSGEFLGRVRGEVRTQLDNAGTTITRGRRT